MMILRLLETLLLVSVLSVLCYAVFQVMWKAVIFVLKTLVVIIDMKVQSFSERIRGLIS